MDYNSMMTMNPLIMMNPEIQQIRIMNLQSEVADIRSLVEEVLNCKKFFPAKAAEQVQIVDTSRSEPRIDEAITERKITGAQAESGKRKQGWVKR